MKKHISRIINNKRKWIDSKVNKPDLNTPVTVRLCHTTKCVKETEVEVYPIEDVKIASYDGTKWKILPPYPKYDYSPLSNKENIKENVVITHWSMTTSEELEWWNERFDLIRSYDKLELAVDNKNEELVYRALLWGASLINQHAPEELKYLSDILYDLQHCIDVNMKKEDKKMPWILDENGEKKYIVSSYSKDDLPTWDEIYNKFYTKRVFYFDNDNDDHLVLDPYMKRPYRKLLMGWMCNYLNKLIYEDKIDISEFLLKHGFSKETKFSFTLIEDELDCLDRVNSLFDHNFESGFPKIFTCIIPNTNDYSIFNSNKAIIDIDHLMGNLEMVILVYTPYDIDVISPNINSRYADKNAMELILFLLKDVIEYFENGIGWKD